MDEQNYSLDYEKKEIIPYYERWYTDSVALYKDICTFYQLEYKEENQKKFDNELGFVFSLFEKLYESYKYWKGAVSREEFKKYHDIDLSTLLYILTTLQEHLEEIAKRTMRIYQFYDRQIQKYWEEQPEDWRDKF